MKKLEKADGQSMDIVESNIEQLKELFPEVFAEGRINFDRLQEVLGNYVVTDEDHYNFTWHGKRAAGRLAQTPSTGTLRPCPQESVDWDTTQNLFIEGDNLEVLKLLQKSYHRQIKMIYIDPPYNTGNDFVYEDDFKDGVKNYLAVTGQLDDEGKKKGTNSSTAGRYHTNWLNMMYPRLKVARNLLRNDGVIFISIDDVEVENLKKICHEIFGEDNFVACLPTVMNLKGNNDEFGFAGTHEYTLVYIKDVNSLEDLGGIPLTPEDEGEYDQVDTKGAYKKGATLMRTGKAGAREHRPKGYYPIYVSSDFSRMSLSRKSADDIEVYPKTKKGKDMSWRRSPETLQASLDDFIIVPTKTGGASFYKKQRLEEDRINGKKPKSLFYKAEYSSGNGTEAVKNLLGERVFSNPKPLELIKDFVLVGGGNEEIILDFFAGSATTGHAIYELNSSKEKKLKFILVQLPEPLDPKDKEQKQAIDLCDQLGKPRNLAELSKERLRRVSKKIKEENPLFGGDLGFKVFKLDTSNIKTWEAGFDTLKDDLIAAADYIKQDRSSDDIVFELLLKYGLDLTVPIETRTIAGKKVYSIGMGALVVCLDNDVPMETINGIGALKEELKPEIMRVVFKDSGFKDDVVKTNALQTLKRFGIEDIKSL
ncbi:MAG: site-specific DNA-methyltransferase [Micavibrio aeruginosavorus]|uniref:site-specific DNA-methyltransferase (adenine-specific) n=1 Tax=Micavibrio aeruginosavorus TaxID=349221 RepID=A0A2W5N3F6_9BACT|nr:MAG: site-specific DNA-methyltransferase [Micavibrio aeruginosavorus]